jgi:glyoxylase-like metal-dependent hydrolase (beta-lactamase superfamily II)
MSDTTWTRVADPGFELTLPQDEPTRAVLALAPWLQPWAVTEDLALRIGSSAVLVRTPSAVVVVDPWLAFDDPARFEARLAALAETGCPAETVDIVVNTHVDGIGANVVPGTTDKTFPNARYLVPAAALAAVADGRYPGTEALTTVAEPVGASPLVDDVSLVNLPGHADGHLGVAIGSPVRAVVTGHLFVHPAQVAAPDKPDLDDDPDVAARTRRELLARCADEGIVLIGPLWEAPGAARVVREGTGFALEAYR